MFKRVSTVLGIATLALAGCNESPSGPGSAPCDDFLLEYSDLSGDTVTMASGVSYIDAEIGTGVIPVSASSTVTVNFTGYYSDPLGTRFQSSCQQGLRPVAFHAGSGALTQGGGYYVIEGFQYGVAGMREQGLRRVFIPAELAYGSVEENPDHPLAGRDLIFDLHLVGLVQGATQ